MRTSSVILSAILALTAFVTAVVLEHQPAPWSGVWRRDVMVPSQRTTGPDRGHNPASASRSRGPRTEAEFLAGSARRFLEAGNYQGALELFRAAFAADPSRVELLAALGLVSSQLGRDVEAEHYLVRYLDNGKSDDPAIRAHLGIIQLRLRKYAAAAANLSRGLRSHPANGPLNCAAAAAYARMADADRALYYLEIARRHLGAGILPYLADPNFDSIRDRPEFKKIVAGVLVQANRKASGQHASPTVQGRAAPPPK
ncbi:MAG: tetratricopeptide repeat protein [Kiritimatiellaeota bacterium]|nr:tetratricopeptide repeat protein [Kiritimatiellota bacterium]